MQPSDTQAVDSLIHHVAFQSLSRVWHWGSGEQGKAYIVHLKSLGLGSYYTRASTNPQDAVQEALRWLAEQEKDLENPTQCGEAVLQHRAEQGDAE